MVGGGGAVVAEAVAGKHSRRLPLLVFRPRRFTRVHFLLSGSGQVDHRAVTRSGNPEVALSWNRSKMIESV